MTTIRRSGLLPYSAKAIYDLVNDIEQYPQFMDGCVGAEILHRDEGTIEARLHLSRAGITHSFATRNFLTEPESIRMELIDGPFEQFAGCWRFKALAESACKVSLEMEFSFSNKLLGAAAGKLFDSVSSNLVYAVSKRATQVLGAAV